MLPWITLLLVLQLTGEVIQVASGVPVPGPVIGMALLFAGLLLRWWITGIEACPAGLVDTAQGLLRYLALLFVPAGVGVMVHVHLLADQWLPISAAVIVGTLLTIAITALVMRALDRSR